MGWKFPEIPRPRSVVRLHYLEHFGASDYEDFLKFQNIIFTAPSIFNPSPYHYSYPFKRNPITHHNIFSQEFQSSVGIKRIMKQNSKNIHVP